MIFTFLGLEEDDDDDDNVDDAYDKTSEVDLV